MTVPSWVPGQELKPAPMPLLLVQSFVNTWDGDDGSDLLLDPADARDWLTEAGLWSAQRTPDPAELHLARGVREGIRAMLVANAGGPQPEPATAESLRQPGLPAGLLRPFPQPGRGLVRHGHLRQPDQEPQAQAAAAMTTGRAAGG